MNSKSLSRLLTTAFASVCLLLLTGFGPCKKWFGCSSCDSKSEVVSKTNEQQAELQDAIYLADEASATTGTVVANFPNEESVKLVLTLNEPSKLTLESIVSEIKTMVPTFDINSVPKAQQKLFANEAFKTACLRRKFFKEMLSKKDFQGKLFNTVKSVARMMIAQEIVQSATDSINISDEEIENEYNSNKMNYIKQLGGTKLLGVRFSNQDEAEALKNTLTERGVDNEADFVQEIRGQNLQGSFRNFDYVSKDMPRNVHPLIISYIEDFDGQYPEISVIPVDVNEVWVVMLPQPPRETIYRSLSESRRDIENVLKQGQLLTAYEDIVKKCIEDVGGKIEKSFEMAPNQEAAWIKEMTENALENAEAEEAGISMVAE